MSRQRLGAKRVRQLEAIVGRGIHGASVRGGEPHGQALCWMRDGDVVWANWLTKEHEPAEDIYARPWWGDRPVPEGCRADPALAARFSKKPPSAPKRSRSGLYLV